ncbi:unnamed protein product, partial [Phaeothamnion confervicola]
VTHALDRFRDELDARLQLLAATHSAALAVYPANEGQEKRPADSQQKQQHKPKHGRNDEEDLMEEPQYLLLAPQREDEESARRQPGRRQVQNRMQAPWKVPTAEEAPASTIPADQPSLLLSRRLLPNSGRGCDGDATGSGGRGGGGALCDAASDIGGLDKRKVPRPSSAPLHRSREWQGGAAMPALHANEQQQPLSLLKRRRPMSAQVAAAPVAAPAPHGELQQQRTAPLHANTGAGRHPQSARNARSGALWGPRREA